MPHKMMAIEMIKNMDQKSKAYISLCQAPYITNISVNTPNNLYNRRPVCLIDETNEDRG